MTENASYAVLLRQVNIVIGTCFSIRTDTADTNAGAILILMGLIAVVL